MRTRTKAMIQGRRLLGAALALGALAATGTAAPVSAQDVRVWTPREKSDCRCVDQDGNPIENCTCFAMPDVERLTSRVMARFERRARLGISLGSDEEDAGLGARVVSVLEDGPADDAGVRVGDLIVTVNGRNLLEPLGPDLEEELDEDGPLPTQRLIALVQQVEPGDDVMLEILRDGERQTLTVEAGDLDDWGYRFSVVSPRGGDLGERMEVLRDRMGAMRLHMPREGRDIRIWTDSAHDFRFFSPGEEGSHLIFRSDRADGILRSCPDSDASDRVVFFSDGCIGGLKLVELNPELADYFGTDHGVLVADVHEDSALGLRPGDVVLSVGDREATDPERMTRILSSYGAEEPVTLRIMRQKRAMDVQGTLGR